LQTNQVEKSNHPKHLSKIINKKQTKIKIHINLFHINLLKNIYMHYNK